MMDKELASISFEEVWKSLEEQDKTGVYKRAREMAGIAREQLEYAFNHGYETAKAKYARPQGEWIPVSKRLPEEKNLPGCDYGFDFKEVLCTTIWGDVRAYKFGKPIGHEQAHFWLAGRIMDEYVIAWQPLPEPYKEGSVE